jgi:hypothetical protein
VSQYAECNGLRIVSGSIAIPAYGTWVADLKLATPDPLSGPVTLTIADLTMRGTIVTTDTFAGLREVRLVGGAGGWRNAIPAQAYQSAAGINLSLVLKDAAALVGETVNVVTDTQVGFAFVREAAPAERVLRQIAGFWWIDLTGVTQVGTRTNGTIASAYTVISYDGARGLFEIATETLGDWMPGRTFTNALVPVPQTISLVRIDIEDGGKLRHWVLSNLPGPIGSIQADRLLDNFRRIIRAEQPTVTFVGLYLYAVQAVHGQTVDALPVDTTIPLPGITNTLLWPSILGAQATPQVGSQCVVAFLNGNPARPIVFAGDPNTFPSSAQILGSSPAAARVGDSVTITPAEIASAGLTANLGTGVVTATNPFTALITSGSSKVTIG